MIGLQKHSHENPEMPTHVERSIGKRVSYRKLCHLPLVYDDQPSRCTFFKTFFLWKCYSFWHVALGSEKRAPRAQPINNSPNCCRFVKFRQQGEGSFGQDQSDLCLGKMLRAENSKGAPKKMEWWIVYKGILQKCPYTPHLRFGGGKKLNGEIDCWMLFVLKPQLMRLNG